MPESVVQGVGKVIPKQIRLADGLTLSQAYGPTDVLSTVLTEGDQEPSLATPLTYWDPISGVPNFLIELVPTDTAGVTPAVYVLQTQVTRPSTGQTAVIWTGQLEVLPAAGVAPSQPVYISLADIMVEISSISDYQQMFRDDTGFENQRARSRRTLDELIQRHGASSWMDSYYGAGGRSVYRNTTLDDYLSQGYLRLTQPLVDHQVFYTLATIFSSQMMSNPKTFSEMARDYRVRADMALRGATAEIRGPQSDGTGTGQGSGVLLAIIDFSSTHQLRA